MKVVAIILVWTIIHHKLIINHAMASFINSHAMVLQTMIVRGWLHQRLPMALRVKPSNGLSLGNYLPDGCPKGYPINIYYSVTYDGCLPMFGYLSINYEHGNDLLLTLWFIVRG